MVDGVKAQKAPLVSIITPSFNQGAYIERTILSVLRQDYPNIEYVVVDGASTDTTTMVLEKHSGSFAKLIVEKDGGHGDALNKGFKLASGDILTYLNSDDCYTHKGVISSVVEKFQTKKVDVVYGRRQVIDEKGFFERYDPFIEFSEEYLKKACYLGQECVFWTKSIYQNAGNYIDTKLNFAVDYDLWFRFMEHNASFFAVDEQYGLFRFYSNSKTGSSWLDVGFPEVQELQKKYLGYSTSLAEITEHHHSYALGVDSRKFAEASYLNDKLHEQATALRRKLLANAPLDSWVYAELGGA